MDHLAVLVVPLRRVDLPQRSGRVADLVQAKARRLRDHDAQDHATMNRQRNDSCGVRRLPVACGVCLSPSVGYAVAIWSTVAAGCIGDSC